MEGDGKVIYTLDSILEDWKDTKEEPDYTSGSI